MHGVKKNNQIKFLMPSRDFALLLQYLGMLVIGILLLTQNKIDMSLWVLQCIYLLSASLLGAGILIRRFHDKE